MAADAFGLDLRVMGGLGQAPEVGAVGGPRSSAPDGQSYLLIRLADGRFVPAAHRPGAPAPIWPLLLTRGPDDPSRWGKDLTSDERQLVTQEAAAVTPPDGTVLPANAGPVAEMEYLATKWVQARDQVLGNISDVLASLLVQALLGRSAGPEIARARDDIAAAESFGRRIQPLLQSEPFTRRSARLAQEYSRAALADSQPPANVADLAETAAKVRTLAEQSDPGGWDDSSLPGQMAASSMLSELERWADETVQALQASTQGVQAATDTLVERVLRELSGPVDELADGQIARNLADGSSDLLAVARLQASSASAAAADSLLPYREAEQIAREWQVRDRAALEEFDGSTDSRELPPGFGAAVLDANGQPRLDAAGRTMRQYPLGHQGRFLWLGGAPLDEPAAIVQLIVLTLPQQDAHLARRVDRQLTTFLKKEGRHAFMQQLLEGGLTVYVELGGNDATGPGQSVAVQFDLELDMNLVHYVRGLETEGTPVGQKRHHQVESEKEYIATLRRLVENERNVTAILDAVTPFSAKGLLATASIALTGTSTTSYTTGYDIVSDAKRAPRYEHESAYFDFRGAVLRTTVYPARPSGLPSLLPARLPHPGRIRAVPLTVRAAFPIEVAPPKEAGDPPGAFREMPRELPGSKRFGYTQAELANDPDGSRHAATVRLEKVLHHVLSEPEWVGAGLRDLREQVLLFLHRAGQLDQPAIATVNYILSEPSILRLYSDLLGAGALSPKFGDLQLLITARLRTVQPSWIGKLGIKEESQRFTSVPDDKEQSGSAVLTLSGQVGTGGVPRGGQEEPIGERSEISGGLQVGGAVSASRAENADTGSGDIRGMVLWEKSELDLAEMMLTVKLVRPGDTDATAPLLHSPVLMGLRIPHIQLPRWKYRLEEAVSGQPGPAPVPVDDEPDDVGSLRYPPESMVAGKGIGFSMIVYLQGSEDVLREIIRLVQAVDKDKSWAKIWTSDRLAHLLSLFAPRFSREALTSHASLLFSPGGIRYEVSLPARSGHEIITVTVAATHGQKPSALGRIKDATLEVMPSAFAGSGGDDTVGSGVNLNAILTAVKGLGEHANPKGLGFLAQLAAARSVTASSGAFATGFSLQAMLYRGPARLFTYDDVELKIQVKVRHQVGVSAPGLAQWLSYAAADKAAAVVARPPAAPPEEVIGRKTLTGSVQFISHEELARDHPVEPRRVQDVGVIEVMEIFGHGQRGWSAIKGGAVTPVQLPAVTPYLGDGGHVVVNADDQVMEVLSPHIFGMIIHSLLADAGLDAGAVGDLPWVLTEPAHLAAAFGGVRPGPIRHTFVKKGNPAKLEFADRHVTLTIEGFPTNARKIGDRPVKLFQMHVAEGGPVVSGETSTTTLLGFNVAIPGLSELFGGNSFNWLQEITYGHGWYTTKGAVENLTVTQGRLLQATRTYLEATADMVYRVHVVGQNKSLALDSDVEYFGKILKVKDGLSWLTLEKPAADPREPAPGPPHDPDTVMAIGRRPAGGPQALPAAGESRVRLVDSMPATRAIGDDRKIPWVQLIPPSAALERLYPLSGDGNPVLDAVQKLLRKEAPWVLEDHTTVEIEVPGLGNGNGLAGGQRVPARLANVLNLQSLTMMADLVVSTGLVLHAIRQGPGHNERVQIVLQGRRDQRGRGYVYLQSIEGNTVRYMFALHVRNRSWMRLRSGGLGTAASQTGEPTIHNPTTGPSGAGGATGLSSWTLHPEGAVSQSTGEGGYHQTMDDTWRDTMFFAGGADRYGGDLELTISLVRTWLPSTLVNKVALNLPRYASSLVQDAANQRREERTAVVPLKERVLIPSPLIRHEIMPELPPGDLAAIEEERVIPGPTATALRLTAQDLRSGRVLNLGYDPAKLQVLHPELLARLAGNERPDSGQASFAVARLTEHGTRTQDVLRYIFSAPTFNRYLPDQLGAGMTMPLLVREGGPVTDTYGQVTVRVELGENPLVLSKYPMWNEGVRYGFDEHGQLVSRSGGWSFGLTGGAGFNTGDAHRAIPSAPNVTDFAVSAAVGSREERSSTGVQQTMTRVDAHNRSLSWIRVTTDVHVTVVMTAYNKRDWIDLRKLGTWLGGGQVAVRFLVRNGLELALSPEASIDLGVYHPGGIPVGSGTFFPPPPERRPASTEDLVRAAYSLPFLDGAFAVQIDWDGAHFLAGDQQIDAAELAAQLTVRLGELGDPPSPDTPEEERPPPGPTKLKNLDDPIVLISPSAAAPSPGQAVSPAQALADAIGRPVLAPDSSYRITRSGAVLAVSRPSPEATGFGRDWQAGHWVAVFPRAQGRDPHPLRSRNLVDAIREARDENGELKWSLAAGHRPEMVPPPNRDVHYPVQDAQLALDKWRNDVDAARHLAAAARQVLPHTGKVDGDLASLTSRLDRADSSTRAVAGPPARLPVTAAQRAEVWQDLTRFSRAASDLSVAVTEVLNAAFTQWRRLIDPFQEFLGHARGVVHRNGAPGRDLAAAFARFNSAVAEIPKPPAGLPATAAQVSDAVRAMGRIDAAGRKADHALSDLVKLAAQEWDARLATALALGRSATELLPDTGPDEPDLEDRLAVPAPAPPVPSLGASILEDSVQQAWQALLWVAGIEKTSGDVLVAAAGPAGLRSRVAARAGRSRGGQPDAALHRRARRSPDHQPGRGGRAGEGGQARLVAGQRAAADHSRRSRCRQAVAGRQRAGPAQHGGLAFRKRHYRRGFRRGPDGSPAGTPGKKSERVAARYWRPGGRPRPPAVQGRRHARWSPVHCSALARVAAGPGGGCSGGRGADPGRRGRAGRVPAIGRAVGRRRQSGAYRRDHRMADQTGNRHGPAGQAGRAARNSCEIRCDPVGSGAHTPKHLDLCRCADPARLAGPAAYRCGNGRGRHGTRPAGF